MDTDLIELSDSDDINTNSPQKNNNQDKKNTKTDVKKKTKANTKAKTKNNKIKTEHPITNEVNNPSFENIEYKYKKHIEPDKDIIDRNNIVKENDEIILIQKENIHCDNKNIMKFIKFCIDRRLFDDTFYDFGNAFSIMATKLPSTFDIISLDGKLIENCLFIEFFSNEISFNGDIKDVYNNIDKDDKGHITWEDFIEFFIPFVRYVTI